LLTAQTTIDYYNHRERRVEAAKRGETYRNPFDLGAVRNWQEAGAYTRSLFGST
jgi:hypothetical protein